jgi:hypothetical protein
MCSPYPQPLLTSVWLRSEARALVEGPEEERVRGGGVGARALVPALAACCRHKKATRGWYLQDCVEGRDLRRDGGAQVREARAPETAEMVGEDPLLRHARRAAPPQVLDHGADGDGEGEEGGGVLGAPLLRGPAADARPAPW